MIGSKALKVSLKLSDRPVSSHLQERNSTGLIHPLKRGSPVGSLHNQFIPARPLSVASVQPTAWTQGDLEIFFFFFKFRSYLKPVNNWFSRQDKIHRRKCAGMQMQNIPAWLTQDRHCVFQNPSKCYTNPHTLLSIFQDRMAEISFP